MKHLLKNISLATAVLVVNLVFYSCSSSQTVGAGSPEFTSAIDNNSWTFTALTARPQVGRSGVVNGVYTVMYSPGKLHVYLPYTGRAYGNADILNNDGPLDFTITNFTADKEELKSGKWRLVLKPTGQSTVQSMTFLLYSNGKASVDIIMTNRSPISFSGNFKANN